MKLSGKWYQMLPNVGRTNREPNVGRFGNHENDTGDHQRIFYTISNDYSIDQNCEIRYTNKITFISCDKFLVSPKLPHEF